jgi:hypothetical protein
MTEVPPDRLVKVGYGIKLEALQRHLSRHYPALPLCSEPRRLPMLALCDSPEGRRERSGGGR